LVTGVIHDEQKLFVTDERGLVNKGREYWVHFSEVTQRWIEHKEEE